MKQRLLHKTLKIYLLFSVSILMITAPIFYFVTNKIFVNDIDETLLLRKKEFEHYSLPNLKEKDIPIINKSNKNVKIIKNSSNIKKTHIISGVIYDSLSKSHKKHRILQTPINIEGKPYVYRVQINLENGSLIKNIAFVYCIVLFLLITGLFFITRYYSIKVWFPFYRTLNIIEHFDIEQTVKAPSFPDSNIQEFDRLKQALQYLINRNISTYNSQKEFIGNAAHELQTPIAVLQAQVETLIQQEEITEEKAELFATIKETIAKLNRLNKNLLLLSKIEYLSTINIEKIDVNSTLNKIIHIYKIPAKEKNLHLSCHFENEHISLDTNAFLFETLISNLISNAIKHNYEGGKISIKVNSKRIEISNTSESEQLPTEKIFERFTKLNPSSSGSGIGLAIVKKIITVFRWKMNYHYFQNSHFFTIHLI